MRTRLGKLARACAIALALAAALRAWADTHDKVQLWKGGPYWATKNIGAEEPWDFGYYFWWGDTVGYARSGGTWTDSEDGDGSGYYSDVTWVSSAGQQMSSSPFSQSSCPTWGKDNSALLLEHYIDSTGNLLATRDAATEHLGSPWRMPTSDEIQALVDNCTTEWITTNGVYGSLVTGKGAYANRSIFLPAAGSGDGAHLYYPGSDGLYWSSAPNSDDSSGAWNLYFDSDYFNRQGDGRFFGRAVRPVQGVLSTGVKFTAGAVSSSESKTVKVTVYGGSLTGPSSVKVLMAYQTAAAADLDLKNATVNGEPVKGGLKFPLTLAWDTGDTSPVTIEMPVKADKSVEDDETFTFQLADAVGMEVGETQECTVTVNDPSFEELRGKIEEGTATKAESNTWTKASYEGTPYMRGLAYPADGGKVTGSAYCPENKKVTLKATAGKGWKFLGWRQGTGNNGGSQSFATEDYVATTPSLVIDRTTKPAKDTRTSTTLTGITESTTFYAVFEGDPRVTATPVAFKEEGGVVATDGGKVTGAGRYAPGKKVTLKASANKGFAFGGWYDVNGKLRMENGKLVDGEGGPSPVSAETTPLSQSASLSFEMGEEDVDLYARFVTVEEDAGSIAAGLNGGGILPPSEEEPVSLATNVWAGVYLQWPVAAEALSQTTVKVSGLPSGLKFTAKDIMKKGSKTKVEIPANTIYGAPTAASKTDKDGNPTPSNVKITVTTAGKSSVTYAIALTVAPLPEWAVGTFCGGYVDYGAGTLTIAANGKISGKFNEGTAAVSLSAASFDAYDPDAKYLDATGVFFATLTYKAGGEDQKLILYLIEHSSGGLKTGLAVLDGFVQFFRTDWKNAKWKAAAVPFSKAKYEYGTTDISYKPGTVTLKFASSGAVSASGVFVTGKDGKGKDVVYKASATTTLIPTSDIDADGKFSACAYVNFPPKAGKFAGCCDRVDLRWTGTKFAQSGMD